MTRTTNWTRRPEGWPDHIGETHLRNVYDGGEVVDVEVIRADPCILISGRAVRGLVMPPFATVTDDVFTLRSPSTTLVYRLVDYDPTLDVWLGQWPD